MVDYEKMTDGERALSSHMEEAIELFLRYAEEVSIPEYRGEQEVSFFDRRLRPLHIVFRPEHLFNPRSRPTFYVREGDSSDVAEFFAGLYDDEFRKKERDSLVKYLCKAGSDCD